jgi:hypothetical protein
MVMTQWFNAWCYIMGLTAVILLFIWEFIYDLNSSVHRAFKLMFSSLASKLIILLYASSNWVFSTAPYFSSAVLQLYNIYVKNHQMALEGLHKKHDGHSRSMRWIMLYHFRNILHPKLQFVLAFIHNHFLCNLLWIVWLKLALVYLTVVNTIFIYAMAHLTISYSVVGQVYHPVNPDRPHTTCWAQQPLHFFFA